MGGRVAILTGLYVTIFLFGFPLILLAVLGIADSLLGLRTRWRRGNQ
jgi:hypothetical protein